MWPLIVLVAIIVSIRFAWRTYNSIVPLRNACRESESNIHVMQRKRETLVNTIVGQTNSFTDYERDILITLSRDMRNTGGGFTINRLRDAYPQLLTNSRISEQLLQLDQLESELQQTIAVYNYRTKEVNNVLRRFPELVFAKLFGWREERYFAG